MTKITRIVAREIIDSRGYPTIESSVLLANGSYGTASVPSGSVTGKLESHEVRDNDNSRFMGMGVLQATANINQPIAQALTNFEINDQTSLDKRLLELDGGDDNSKYGTNAILSVSIAALKALSNSARVPLFQYIRQTYSPQSELGIPAPIFNLINGGKHGAGNLDFQEFHVIPSTRFTFSQALRCGVELFHSLRSELIHRNAIHSVGDEGGFAPNLFTNSDALELLKLVINNSAYTLNQDVFLGLDVASDSFVQNNSYTIKDSPKALDREGMIAFYQQLLKDYALFSLEDPLRQDDWSGWSKLRELLPATSMLVGDDLIMTDHAKLTKAIESRSVTAAIFKPNQLKTVTANAELIRLAQQNNIYTILSHRSGETNDNFIADFAVGMGTNFVKFGAPNRGERVAKYNRLLEIESFLANISKVS